MDSITSWCFFSGVISCLQDLAEAIVLIGFLPIFLLQERTFFNLRTLKSHWSFLSPCIFEAVLNSIIHPGVSFRFDQFSCTLLVVLFGFVFFHIFQLLSFLYATSVILFVCLFVCFTKEENAKLFPVVLPF